jgi:hypothetical protein
MKHLGDGLPGALTELLRGSPLSDSKVAFAWTAAVGPALDRVTTVKLERRVLFVDAATTPWSHEVQRSAGVILSRLQTLLGKDTVSSIIVRAKD